MQNSYKMMVLYKMQGSTGEYWYHSFTLKIWINKLTGERYATTIDKENPVDGEYLQSLSHIERIVNGLEGESGVLLYLRDSKPLIRKLAKIILKEGRQSVMFCYYKQEYCENGTNPGLKGYPHCQE